MMIWQLVATDNDDDAGVDDDDDDGDEVGDKGMANSILCIEMHSGCWIIWYMIPNIWRTWGAGEWQCGFGETLERDEELSLK